MGKDKRGIRVYPKNLPDDVWKIILNTQKKVQEESKCQFGLDQTLYKLIRLGAKQSESNESNP
jgi:hypothetical protein